MALMIHRQERVVYVNGKPVELTRAEHSLLVTLGMMSNRLAPYDLILDIMCEGRVQIPADKEALISQIGKLRKKIGPDVVQTVKGNGYILSGDVRFVG